MKKLFFGAAALAGAALMFVGWLADSEKKAAADRIEQWQPPQATR